jgi:DNA-binding transcriptional regulator YhcF (GntR family)
LTGDSGLLKIWSSDDFAGRSAVGRKVRDGLVRTILDRIFQGKLAAGQRLPSIGELGRAHGMSSASVREAIQKLSLMGLVRIRQGGGTFLDENIPSMLDILDARKYVEMATCLLAARNATKGSRGSSTRSSPGCGTTSDAKTRSPSRRRTSRSTSPSAGCRGTSFSPPSS